MQTLIDISVVEEEFFVAMLNSILAYKKESKKQIWDYSVCLSAGTKRQHLYKTSTRLNAK